MAKGVITILGTIGVPRDGQEKAKYYLSDDLKSRFSLKKDKYTNMLPLLIENFKDSYGNIEVVYTRDAKKIQEEVLQFEEIEFNIEQSGTFISNIDGEAEATYPYFLEQFDAIVEKYDKVIIDVSHGFRHLPILATVNMIIQNIKDPKKIEYIFFAKEIKKFTEYEVIDLKEYLDLANLSFLLSTFNQNYTVSSSIRFKNPLYKEISKELSEFSNHFLSNSLKSLIEGNLISDIVDNLNTLKKKKSIQNFNVYIDDIISHLNEIKELKDKKEWEKLYELSKIMDKRGYQLNAITLLFEALGFYCLESLFYIESFGDRVKEYYSYIEEKRKPEHIYSTYTMTNQTRTLVKILDRFRVSDERLFINNDRLKNLVIDYLEDVDKIHKFSKFIQDLEAVRNNLAHGNSSNSIDDVKKVYQSLLSRFKDFCIDKDIFSTAKSFKRKSSVERLEQKFSKR